MRKTLLLTGLLLAACSAFFSVTGLATLFYGATLSVMLMASALEVAKIVTAAHLRRSWRELDVPVKGYLSVAVIALMAITSFGIYGYLSDAFQRQRIRIQQVDRQISVIESKVSINDKEVSRYTQQIQGLTQIRNSQEENLSKLIQGDRSTARVNSMIKSADAQISLYSKKIDSLNGANASHIQEIAMVRDKNMDLEEQIGGFRFVADAFNMKIETAVKWLILLIVAVFDPLAIALILAYNTRRKEEMENKTTADAPTNMENGTGPLQRVVNTIKKKLMPRL